MHGSTFRLGLPFWFEMYRMARSNWSSLNSSRIWMGSQPAVSGFVLTNIWGKILRKFWSELVVSICGFFGFWLCRVWRFQLLCFSSCLRRWSSLTNVTNPSRGTHPQCARDEWLKHLKPSPVGGSYNEVLGLALKVKKRTKCSRPCTWSHWVSGPRDLTGPLTDGPKKGRSATKLPRTCVKNGRHLPGWWLVVFFFFLFCTLPGKMIPHRQVFFSAGSTGNQADYVWDLVKRDRCLAYRSTCIHILWNSLSVF